MKTLAPSLLRNRPTGVIALLLWAELILNAATLHVTTVGDDSASGLAWSLAKRTVGAALQASAAGDEIWVAEGRYPERLVLTNGVALLGGFRGDETTASARDIAAHPTVLDGSNQGIVLTLGGVAGERVVDGFTIQNGSNTGIYITNAAFVIRHSVIRANLYGDRLGYGGGIFVANIPAGTTAAIDHNLILDNYSRDGGGIACIDAAPRITHNVIMWNLAQQNGGGLSCWRNSSPLVANNTFVANAASIADEGMPVPVGGGAIFATADDLDGRPHPTAISSPVIVNNLIVANGSRKGGGLALIDANGGVPVVVNNTIAANSGSGIYWGSSALVPLAPVLRNNLVSSNACGLEQAPGTPSLAVIEHNCVQGNQVAGQARDFRGLPDPTGHEGNLSVDPRFADVPFLNFHLQPGSPCIDAGKPPGVLPIDLDVEEQVRVRGAGIDIGAHESDGRFWPEQRAVFHVHPGGDDAADGRGWGTAFKTIQRGIDQAKWRGGEVRVATGTYGEHLLLPAFVHLYGGFAGHEAQRSERDPASNPTRVDGGGVPGVVTIRNAGYGVTEMDGFTVQNGGNYTGGGGLNKYGIGGLGGGFMVVAASPTLANNRITRNGLAYDPRSPPLGTPSHGAGVYCHLSYAILSGNTITENEILNDFDGSGGGIYFRDSEPVIEGNTIRNNHAVIGAGLYGLASEPRIVGNTIADNAMYNTYPLPLYLGSTDGALTLQLCPDFLIERNTIRSNTAALGAGVSLRTCLAGRLQNNLIVGNHAFDPTAFGGTAGGVYCLVTTGAVDAIRIVHNTIVGNTATNFFAELGGGLAFSLPQGSTRLVIANNIVASNSSGLFRMPTPVPPDGQPVLEHNLVFNTRSNYINVAGSATDLNVGPRLVDPAGGAFQLQAGAPGIDGAGLTYTVLADAGGVPRPLDGDDDGVAAPDLGAFEFVHPQADSDQDSLPDAWELAFGCNPTRDDAGEDADGDGAVTRDEFLAGTDPRKAGSVLRLAVRVSLSGDEVRLSWFGVAGRQYDLSAADSMASPGAWSPVVEEAIGADAPIEVVRPVPTGRARFYRLITRFP